MSRNWLANQLPKTSPAGQAHDPAIFAQFKRDIDDLITHPRKADWPPDQQATHAGQLLEIAAQEQFINQVPDYQLDWLNGRL